jgi:hypothetical protein
MLHQLTRRTSFSPTALLQEDANLRSNCFKLSFEGKLTTGFELELNHAMGSVLLFTGSRFTRRRDGIRGCVYEIDNRKIGFVRRATIEWEGRDNGIPLLVRPHTIDKTMLLQVTIGYAAGITPKERLWAGVDTNGSIVQQTSQEILISFDVNDFADIFTEDGFVRRVERVGDEFKLVELPLLTQGNLRIEHALAVINSAERSTDQGVKRADAGYHQLAAILAIKSIRSTPIFQQVFDLLEQEAQAGKLTKGVRKHVLDALGKAGLEYEYFRDNYCGDLAQLCLTEMRFTSVTSSKGAPAERKAKLAERAERNRQERLGMRGASSGGKQVTSKKKK